MTEGGGIEIRAACSPGEARIAVLSSGALLDAAIWRPGKPDGFGDTHLVRVQRLAPALGGAFVLLENGASGFLAGRTKLTEGALAAAQVTRAAQNGKGLRLRLLDRPVESEDRPRLLARGPTPLEELAERTPEAPILLDDPGFGASLPAALRPRLRLCAAAFDTATEDAFASLGETSAPVGPLTASFSPTPALVAIDLDSAGNAAMPEFEANLAAFASLARQIRLRNLSGTILIDPAGVRSRKRPALIPFLRDALAGDPLAPETLGATGSGLLEITRPRRRPPLHELLASPHGRALALLRRLLREGADGARRETELALPPALFAALEADPEALRDFASRCGKPLAFAPDPNLPDGRGIPS